MAAGSLGEARTMDPVAARQVEPLTQGSGPHGSTGVESRATSGGDEEGTVPPWGGASIEADGASKVKISGEGVTKGGAAVSGAKERV